MIAALIADVAGLLLLLAGGTSGIWSSLAVFWSEGLAASITAAVRGGQRLSDLSDEDWLNETRRVIDSLATRPLGADESPHERAVDIARRRARLAELETIDRRTLEGAATFRAARATEDRLASGISGCALVAFPVLQGIFLLLLAVVAPVVGTAVDGLGAGLSAGEMPLPGVVSGFQLPAIGNPLLLLASMGAVLVSGLWGLRHRTGVDAAEAQVREGIIRLFAMQAVLLAGGVLSFVIGWAGLAIGLTVGKLLLDAAAHRRRATS